MEKRTHYKRHQYFSLRRGEACLALAIATVISLMPGYAGLGSTAWAGPNIWTGGLGPRAFSGVATRDMMGNVYAVATGNTQAVYNGHSSTTIYKSPDGGNTWTALGDFGKAPGARYVDDYISLAALADGNTLLLIAGSDEGRSANPSLGLSLLRSTDGGKSWQAVSPAFDIVHKAEFSLTTD